MEVVLLVVGLVAGLVVGLALARIGRRSASGAEAADGAPEAAVSPVEQATTIERQVWAGDPRIDRALGALPLGVVVTDAAGQPVYRNRFADQFASGRHGDALVEAAMREVVAAATVGETNDRPVDLWGPPARNLLLRGSPTYQGSELNGAVVLIEDVTAVQQIDRVRRDFVANVSHELRTPIGAIGILAETLRDSDDPEIIDRLSGRLQSEALRLGDLIDDLLALSKLESGQIDDPVPMDLWEVVAEAMERASGAAEHRQIEVHLTERPAESSVHVDGDPGQMVSAIANLLDNAVKYSDPGSDVVVDVVGHGRTATVTVSDNGDGIPEADRDRIFERFYRVDDARSRDTGGTGLGLSIVRHVVLNHDGAISVESMEGKGSTFVISLPLSSQERQTVTAGTGDER